MQNKKYFIYSVFLLMSVIFLSTSCKKGIDATFTKDFSNVAFTIPATTQSGTINSSGVNVSTGISKYASDNGFSLSNLKSAKIKTCTLTINDTSATPITFDVIDYITAQVGSTGLSTVDIATKNPITHNAATTLTLDLNSTDVAPYIKADNFTYQVTGHTNAPVPHNVPMTAHITFEITASVIK